MEMLYLFRSKGALFIVALAFVVFGTLALAWPVLGIALFAGTMAVYAIAAALFAVYELAIQTGQVARGDRSREAEPPPEPGVRVTLTREAQEEAAARDRTLR